MAKLCDNTLENNISSSPDDTQPVKRRLGEPRQESAVWRWKDDGTYDNRPNDPSISRNTCPLELLVLCAILVS